MHINIKILFIFIGAALLYSACAQDDMTVNSEVERRQITFSTSLPVMSSRAESITKENLPFICVTAFDIDDMSKVSQGKLIPFFDTEKIERVGETDVFISPDCQWPEMGRESDRISFFSFYPALADIEGATLVNPNLAGDLEYKLNGFKVQRDISKQIDFLTAYASGSMKENLFSGIKLPLTHQLCLIDVRAWSAHKSCDIEIAGVRIGDVYLGGDFTIITDNVYGTWSDINKSEKNKVEYIYGEGERIISLKKGDSATSTEKRAVSIMGNCNSGQNFAMMLPYNYDIAWDISDDRNNAEKNMYISVLLRIIDATPTPGKGMQRYPYTDIKQGTEALEIPRVYIAVKSATNTVSRRLYKKGNAFFTDEKFTKSYTLATGEEVKEFGWAALPVTGNWTQGYAYTYTLNYSLGVGLHDPEVKTSFPKAGDPIICDTIDMHLSFTEWKSPSDSLLINVTGH